MTATADTRAQIMDAFGEQLATVGYPGISLLQVARTVGIQKPSIYHHFPGGKEELYTAVALRFIEDYRRRVAEALAVDGGVPERLRALALVSASHASSAITFEQRVYDALDLVAEGTREEVSQQYVAGLLDPVVAFFADAVRTGDVVGEPWLLANGFLHLARALDMVSGAEAVDQVVTLFLDGARPR